MPPHADLILASTSRYRRELLARVIADFRAVSPEVAESRLNAEAPRDMACRLALAKARAVACRHAGAVVIGSDQVAELDGTVLGKPGDAHGAHTQLRTCSGRDVAFHTAVCVIAADGTEHLASDLTRVRFRPLEATEIGGYLDRERPFDCAGSFMAEGLGIALFDAISSDDPTALIGLPLIQTCRLLRRAGIDPLTR